MSMKNVSIPFTALSRVIQRLRTLFIFSEMHYNVFLIASQRLLHLLSRQMAKKQGKQ